VRLWRPQLGLALVSALAVLFVGVVAARRKSPGPLTRVHVRVDELAGPRDCRECHGGWTRGMASACLDCHEVIEEHVATGRGLHGGLARGNVERCAACHSEHHGPGFAMVNRQSFALAGVPDEAAFDHRRVGFAMEGAHLALACSECHANADVDVLPRGEHRYLGLDSDCAACHEDVHEGRMQLACADCHGQQDFAQLESRGHHPPLVGGHARVECRTCHAEGERALEALGGRRHPAARQCVACHASPHDERFLANVSELVDRPPPSACVVCHAPEHERFDDQRLFHAPAEVTHPLHACSGFALEAPHAGLECAACHAPGTDFEARYPGRAADACRACHADPHAGQFTPLPGTLAELGNDCLACHERLHFTPPSFGLEEHARAGLPLTGSHRELACEACHERVGDAPRAFSGTPRRCDACHADAHDAFFEPRLGAGDCGRCHATSAFDAVPRFDHERWTAFAVRGAHEQAACESCHPRSAEPDDGGRTFGRVAEHFGTFAGCITCHADPHGGRFDATPALQVIDGRRDCARCHVETSFRDLASGFDHGLWTGFVLADAHARASCTACHATVRGSQAGASTLTPAKGDACQDCHADPHAGQFERRGATACATCHESALDFGLLAFNHELDARFPLGEAHAGVACAACHAPEATPAGPVVRYKPLGSDCADCHEIADVPLRRRRGGGR
jgi:hypothetical protein